MGKYGDFPSQTQNLQLTPQSETTSIPVTFIWDSSPPGPHVRSLFLGTISSVTHNRLFLLTGDMMAKYSSFLQFETRLTSVNLILTSCFCLRRRARTDKLKILQGTVLYYNPRRITESAAKSVRFTSKSNTLFDSVNV